MARRRRAATLALSCAVVFLIEASACSPRPRPLPEPRFPAAPGVTSIRVLKHLATHVLFGAAASRGENFGGISGIDYDPARATWTMISDDRSDLAPARLYEADIRYDGTGFQRVEILAVTPLLQKDGLAFPNAANGGDVPDPETVRVDPRTGEVWWATEGDRAFGLSPTLYRASRDGRFLGEVPLPEMFRMHPDRPVGPRHNLTVEGITFTPDGSGLWVAMEGPLYQDGPPASLQTGAAVRFTRLDRAGRVLGQYAYPIEPIPSAPSGGRRRADNGVSEILSIAPDTLLVVERSGREVEEGVFQFHSRIYEARVGEATDVLATDTLQGGRYEPMAKRLISDLNEAHLGATDNVEGVSWGPRLSNGNRTLLFVSDDNFLPGRGTHLVLFEAIPR